MHRPDWQYEPTGHETRQMREEIEEAKKEKNRAYYWNYSREYRARNLEKQQEFTRPTGHRQDWGQIHSQLEIYFEERLSSRNL